MRWLSVLVLVIFGCTYDASSPGSGPGPGLGGSSGGDETTTGQGGVSTTVGVEGSSGGGGGSSGGGSSGGGSSEGTSSVTTMPPDPDTGVTTESLPMPRSCWEIHDEDPSLPDGEYEILSSSDDAVVDVYCEMDLDGGGWTLVARSAPGGGGPFGWGVATGALGDESQPYSLDALGIALPFGEILIAQRQGFAEPVARAYVVEVPEGFLEDYRDVAVETEDARTVLGDCDPGDGPTMLRWWGYTADEGQYFFRDIEGPVGQTGLSSHDVNAYFDDCEQGGWLDDQQGALFVR